MSALNLASVLKLDISPITTAFATLLSRFDAQEKKIEEQRRILEAQKQFQIKTSDLIQHSQSTSSEDVGSAFGTCGFVLCFDLHVLFLFLSFFCQLKLARFDESPLLSTLPCIFFNCPESIENVQSRLDALEQQTELAHSLQTLRHDVDDLKASQARLSSELTVQYGFVDAVKRVCFTPTNISQFHCLYPLFFSSLSSLPMLVNEPPPHRFLPPSSSPLPNISSPSPFASVGV